MIVDEVHETIFLNKVIDSKNNYKTQYSKKNQAANDIEIHLQIRSNFAFYGENLENVRGSLNLKSIKKQNVKKIIIQQSN